MNTMIIVKLSFIITRLNVYTHKYTFYKDKYFGCVVRLHLVNYTDQNQQLKQLAFLNMSFDPKPYDEDIEVS